MNKKFINGLLLATLMVGSAGSFTSCKDYDDDIDNLQNQIDGIIKDVAELQEKIKNGSILSSVTETDNGLKIVIDGKDYLCRCLKVGSRNGAPNEWDALLGKYGEDLWNWKDATFWGQEATSGDAACRMARGYYASRYFAYYAAPTRLPTLGFRPVLEPLCHDLSELLIGHKVKIFGPGGESVCGQLLDYDDYDLILQPEAKARFCWGKRLDEQFVVRRNSVIGVRELKD